jgi:ureidoglycolate lyase
LLPLTADADYLVVDRQGLGQNCDEVDLQQSIKPILANG